MKVLKLFLSQFHDEDFHDEVSGITFKQSSTLDVYAISLADNKVSGIQGAVRKNILIPYDLETRDFINSTNLAKEEEKAVVEPVKEIQVELEAPEVEVKAAEPKEPVKKTRKRAPKKEETN